MEKFYLEKPETSNKFGLPMTPSKWVGTPERLHITRLKMTCGGGLGGAQWNIDVERIDDIPTNSIITVTSAISKKPKKVNTLYLVTAENFDIIHMKLDSKNSNFPQGIYDVYILVEEGHEIEFFDAFNCHN